MTAIGMAIRASTWMCAQVTHAQLKKGGALSQTTLRITVEWDNGLGSSSCSSRAIDAYVVPNSVDIPSIQHENASEHEQDDSEDDFDEFDAAEFESSHGQPVRAGSASDATLNAVNNSNTTTTTTIATSSSLLTDPWHAVERKKERNINRPT
eukprot:scaffold1301_cov176-Ochromonas_danica.AAC.2